MRVQGSRPWAGRVLQCRRAKPVAMGGARQVPAPRGERRPDGLSPQLRSRRPARRPTRRPRTPMRRRLLLRDHQGANTPPPLPPTPNETVDARARDIIIALIGRTARIPIPIPIAPSPSKNGLPSNLATDWRHYEQSKINVLAACKILASQPSCIITICVVRASRPPTDSSLGTYATPSLCRTARPCV